MDEQNKSKEEIYGEIYGELLKDPELAKDPELKEIIKRSIMFYWYVNSDKMPDNFLEFGELSVAFENMEKEMIDVISNSPDIEFAKKCCILSLDKSHADLKIAKTIPGQEEGKLGLLNFKVQSLENIRNKISSLEVPTSKNSSKPDNDYKGKMWFKVGVLFAKGDVQKLYKKYNDVKGCFNKITIELGLKETDRPYISETINNYEKSKSIKNIYNKSKLAQSRLILIKNYCEENKIQIDEDFLKEIKSE